ncbi:hypothetical protein AB0M36_37425 [Actinoplanes sp. NPDC051346]|uniref:hypothetical protein n=1 Tax=Actinoplanes sp. NPDC051346 TaxID=3155048 RepID=UPI003434E307
MFRSQQLGAIERIDQINNSRIMPPLHVTMRDDLGTHRTRQSVVLIAEVPATDIPHLVDHRDPGRDNRTKRALDHRVVRLLARRDLNAERANKDLDAAYALRKCRPPDSTSVGIRVPMARTPTSSPQPRSRCFAVTHSATGSRLPARRTGSTRT